jgi:hypothetical protein
MLRAVYHCSREENEIMFYPECILASLFKFCINVKFKITYLSLEFCPAPYIFYVSEQVYKRLKLTLELVKKEMEISKLQVFNLLSSTQSLLPCFLVSS